MQVIFFVVSVALVLPSTRLVRPAQLASPRSHVRICDTPPPLDGSIERVDVTADAVAATEKTFDGLGLTHPIVAANLAASNITAPNALQRAAFEPISAGRDTIIHAWTGSGKTLAFLVPLLERLDASSREPQALVLSPSRELAYQIHRVADAALADSGLRAAPVVGGANANRQLDRIKKERPQIIVGTAGRVCELAFEWKKLKLQRIRHVIIDEVDNALQPPHLDHVLKLLHSMQDGRPLQIILASATADTPAVRRVAAQLLTNEPTLLRLVPPGGDEALGEDGSPDAADGIAPSALGAQLPNSITHGVYVIEPNKGLKAVHALHHTSPAPRCLVFVNSPYRAKVVCERLWEQYGVPAAPLHGQQEREERVDVMRRLLDGRTRIAVTTEMGARGLDLPGLTHVVNLELPTDAAHYVHRAGRCGRAGVQGTVVSLVPPGKAFVVGKLCKKLGVPLEEVSIKGGKVNVGPLPKGGTKGGSKGRGAAKTRVRRNNPPGDGTLSASPSPSTKQSSAQAAGGGGGEEAPREKVRTKQSSAKAAGGGGGEEAPREKKVRRGYPKLQPGPTRSKGSKAKVRGTSSRRGRLGSSWDV